MQWCLWKQKERREVSPWQAAVSLLSPVQSEIQFDHMSLGVGGLN